MKLLLGMARTRNLNAPLNAVHDIQRKTGCDVLMAGGGDNAAAFRTYPNAMRYNNATRKFESLRQAAVNGGYDALLLIDDDQIVNPDDIDTLFDVNADIVWGLTVWRGNLRHWSACVHSTPHYANVMLDQLPLYAREVFGKPIPVVGHGNFCTLIRRPALLASRFARPMFDNNSEVVPGRPGGDWFFAYQCKMAGLKMVCHTGVHVGHIEVKIGTVLWPAMIAGSPTYDERPFIDESARHAWQ